MSVGNSLFWRISWLGRFMVEKNIMLGMVSMKTWGSGGHRCPVSHRQRHWGHMCSRWRGYMANLADPGRHGVCAGRAVVCVDDNDGDDDGGDDKNHGEEHVFPYQRNSAGGGGDQLHNNQQEDSQRQQDRDGQGHLLTWRGGRRNTATEKGATLFQFSRAKHPLLKCASTLTGVCGQIEDQPSKKREQHAGNDDVDDEVERQPQHQEVVGDVQVRRVRAAGVVNPVFPAPVVL